jgi:hypothetical protein
MDQQPTPLMQLSFLIGGSSADAERLPLPTGGSSADAERLPLPTGGSSADAERLPYRGARPLAPVPPEPALRIGELERATACDALSEHFAAGRLDPAELDDRLARALAARSHADLQALFRDLRPRRTVSGAPVEPPVEPPVDERPDPRSAVPVLTSALILCLMLAVGMLVVLGAYNSALLVSALVGGTATAVVGGCATAIGYSTLRRR